MIHGNSFSRGVFRHQLQGRLTEHHRLITFDLPGHGESSDAPDPMRSYSLPGFADAAVELLGKLGVDEAIVLGMSLGGHIGIEMVPRFAGMRGLMIVGSPPVSRDNMVQGFKGLPEVRVAGKQDLSAAEIDGFVHAIFGASAEPFMGDAVARADGRFRARLFEVAGVDQRSVVESSPVPLAVVNGAADRVVNLDYFDSVAYAKLWEGTCYRVAGSDHAPFWEAPAEFNPLLERFLNEVESGRIATRTS
jgi:pimeloyl-ACP methyl ester carboxylesterase